MSFRNSVSSAQPPLGGAPTRLRQIALVVRDLERARHLLTYVLGTEVVFIDPGVEIFGLKNFLVAIGGDIIEVVSPFKPNTTAGRLLSKRGDGGYMVIMQTRDAVARRLSIESKRLAKVIYSHEHDDAVCIQYHPKGIKGGVIPELDSHRPSIRNPEPLISTFSPWHACGPDYDTYSAGMKRCSHLHFIELVCRLVPDDSDTETAAKQWEEIFGVPRIRNELVFTNGRLRLTPGEEGKPEGIAMITIGVDGDDNLKAIFDRASEEGLYRDGWIDMLGVEWYFQRTGSRNSRI